MVIDGDRLNEKQQEAVRAKDGPLLIVAGAGSGKTKTLSARLAYLIGERGVDPQNILAITFTNRAAGEMKARVRATLTHSKITLKKDPFVGTFHAFGAMLLRAHARYFGRTSSFSIYDRSDSLRTLRRLAKDDRKDKKTGPSSTMSAIGRIKNALLTEQDFWGDTNKEEAIWERYEEYEKALKDSNAFDFDDLIEKVVVLFEKHPDVLGRLQKRYTHILIDEYQDVNTSQYKMISLLARAHNNITVVGDDQQSIYKFRFSDFRNFLNFEHDWPGARVVLLEQNYRSTKTIIEASSALIKNNQMQKPKTLWTDNNNGAAIKVIEHDEEFSQADAIVEQAAEALESGKSVGVLFRTNAQSRALEHMFVSEGVEYTLFGALSFYERKEVKDIIAMVRLVYNPKDSSARGRLETSLGKRLTRTIVESAPEHSKDEPSKIIEWVLETTNYLSRLERDFINVRERSENVAELLYFSRQFKDAGAFLEQAALSSPLDKQGVGRVKSSSDKTKSSRLYRAERGGSGGGVHLMTMHLAKGLEFDVVIVAGVSEGLLPHQRSLFSSEEVEEERRLMYVAMTRARKELYLHFYGVPSRFLSEIPGDRLEYDGDRPIDDEERYIEYD